ncbi:orexin receptor type 1-like [Stylophora pistillata]|uniref:orexin receptor type 1-like n=1 Tax=Stylophora pistillata TaxID=50429 RepID=UPI000C0397DD|nr:orexin receptor type 1-like [Stylophora pistillata]
MSSCVPNNGTSGTSYSFVPEPEALRIVRTVVLSLLVVFSLIGNSVVCRAAWRQREAKPFAYYLVSNLAFAEILGSVCVAFRVHADEPPWSWKLGPVMCKIVDPLQVASLLVVTTTLATLAVYRCLVLIKPLITKPTSRQIRCLIIVTWVGSIVISIPSSVFRVVNVYRINCVDYHICEEIFPAGYYHYQNTYSIFIFVINFALPLLIMAVSYALVSKKIREHIFVITRLRDAQSKAMSSACSSTCVGDTDGAGTSDKTGAGENQENIEIADMPTNRKTNTGSPSRNVGKNRENDKPLMPSSNQSPRNNKASIDLENDLLKMVFVIVLVFIVCYIPYQIQFLLFELEVESFTQWTHRYAFTRFVFTLTNLPSALHPVFYGTMSNFYRRAFIKMISCRATN